MSAILTADVAIIGGGPAGALAAHTLVKLGWSVALCEASQFPREHIGISFSAGVREQLVATGIGDLLDRTPHRHDIPVEQRWERDLFELAAKTASIIDRGVFDADLLRVARCLGAHVLQPAAVRALSRTGDSWRLNVRTPTSDMLVEARFVIEATGRLTRFHRRRKRGKAMLALCGHWRGRSAETVRISAESSSWCWAAPTRRDESILICCIDPREFRRMRGSLGERYLELARGSGALPGIAGLQLAGIPRVCDATPYETEGETEGLLRVGDADLALDPLSSSGVQAAIQSALAAGPVVNTLLTSGEDAAAAVEFWRRRRSSRVAQHRGWTAELYRVAATRHPTDFWRDRSEDSVQTSVRQMAPFPHPDQPIVLSEGAGLALAPCLAGGVVRRLECVNHASLPDPVAFVGGVHLAPLLRRASLPSSAREILVSWSSSINPSLACSLLGWAWSHNILEASPSRRD